MMELTGSYTLKESSIVSLINHPGVGLSGVTVDDEQGYGSARVEQTPKRKHPRGNIKALSVPPGTFRPTTPHTHAWARSSTLQKTSASMSTAAQPPEKTPKDTLQQWYKSANDLLIGPVRRKRMPAGRHAVVVSPPAKVEAQVQGEARKQ
ncbi:hypothetical protein HO133_010017 [Letharia lupina]|uniref:Uncharacterized protein n=1 Tax=Letharia lupina TaxID=560253 RepID=A0A8H6FEE9_9LECA|nr:uncharacterized protein HO133_010017 [Letharia lupina]KAF6224823.1 hypothetical protein HO133_010017 [Letharia lupina]